MSTAVQESLSGPAPAPDVPYLSPAREIAAYETLWEKYPTVKKVADLFRSFRHALPSQVAAEVGVSEAAVAGMRERLRARLPFSSFAALFNGDFEYPVRLREAEHAVEVLYYQGDLELLSTKGVAVVGARKASPDGVKRAAKLAKMLAEHGVTVLSGLAAGIDTAAHTAAIENGGRTIAVLGTPIDEFYPKANLDLQKRIAAEHLVVSQVPFVAHDWHILAKTTFFPERNKTMSALSEATVIVEASDTSGSLVQARAAIRQGRKLFILKSCFEKGLRWPAGFLKEGAIKVESGEEILDALKR